MPRGNNDEQINEIKTCVPLVRGFGGDLYGRLRRGNPRDDGNGQGADEVSREVSSQQSAVSRQEMSIEEIQIRRAQVRSEIDHLMWRKRRLDERLDALAKSLDDLTIEISVARIQQDAPKHFSTGTPLRMEIV
jgi:predicted  nucleic acid-binding Zn-ribbon protein